MGYKTKSMLHQIGGETIKSFKGHKARRMRDSNVFVETETHTYVNDNGEEKEYEKIVGFKDKNPNLKKGQNPNEGMSTHYMADDGDRLAYPSIYKSDSGEWKEQSQGEAKERGEMFEFKSNKRMQKFAREGNWKNKRFEDGKFLK